MDSRQQFEEWITKQEWFDGCSIERGGLTDYIDAFTYSQWVAWQASRAVIEPDFYWPDGDEGGSSSVEEMAQDAYDWDGSLWDDQDVACAHELPARTYRSFLDDKGDVQVERIK